MKLNLGYGVLFLKILAKMENIVQQELDELVKNYIYRIHSPYYEMVMNTDESVEYQLYALLDDDAGGVEYLGEIKFTAMEIASLEIE